MRLNLRTMFSLWLKPWSFDGSIPENLNNVIPQEMKLFFQWIIQGAKKVTDERGPKIKEVEKRAKTLSQVLLFNTLSRRQTENKVSNYFESRREMPLQVATGLTIHHSTRSRRIIEFMHSLGCSVNYQRVINIENAIANSVSQVIEENNGVYIPPEIVHDRFIHCAADNVDFAEDTSEGKRTFHGTSMTVYQTREPNDPLSAVTLTKSKSLSRNDFENCVPNITFCSKPPNWSTCLPVFLNCSEENFSSNPETKAAMYGIFTRGFS